MDKATMNHKVFTPKDPPRGTSLQGYMNASFEQLTKAFGTPDTKGSSDGKVKHLWVRDIDGVLCTIYDYKEDLNTGKIENWHVGGEAKASHQLVIEAFLERV